MSDDNIYKLKGNTLLKTNPDDVLHAAIGELDQVIILGVTHEGETYHAASISDIGEIFLEIELFKSEMLRRMLEE